jgi:curved DNA-binding protein
MEYKDYYQALGLSRSATQEEIKRAYRKLARKYHPDVSREPDAENKMKDVNEAYEVLNDPQKRAAYDRLGEQWQAGQEFRPPPNWDAGFEFRGGGFTGADARQFSDFFESLFGGFGPFGGFGEPRGQRFRTRGEDHYAKILITLDDSYRGSTRSLTLAAPEVGPDGRPHMRQHVLHVRIPKGVTEGQRIRLSGQGEPGIGGGPAGDLYLTVGFQPHHHFRAVGRDIHLDVPITPWEAALGTQVTVPTLGGPVEVSVPPNSQSGRKLRLKGRGLPGNPPGDQYVVVQLVTPPADTQARRDSYRRMAAEMPFDPRRERGL